MAPIVAGIIPSIVGQPVAAGVRVVVAEIAVVNGSSTIIRIRVPVIIKLVILRVLIARTSGKGPERCLCWAWGAGGVEVVVAGLEDVVVERPVVIDSG